jgi:hypothetical protein
MVEQVVVVLGVVRKEYWWVPEVEEVVVLGKGYSWVPEVEEVLVLAVVRKGY